MELKKKTRWTLSVSLGQVARFGARASCHAGLPESQFAGRHLCKPKIDKPRNQTLIRKNEKSKKNKKFSPTVQRSFHTKIGLLTYFVDSAREEGDKKLMSHRTVYASLVLQIIRLIGRTIEPGRSDRARRNERPEEITEFAHRFSTGR